MHQLEVRLAEQSDNLHARLAQLRRCLVWEIEEAALAAEHDERDQHVNADRSR
jgi:hypothetical protein